MAWVGSGRISNPAKDVVLCDTGPVDSGTYYFDVYVTSSIAATFELQYRDAENANTLKSQTIAVPANVTVRGFSIPPGLFLTMDQGERLRVIQVTQGLGDVSISIVGNFPGR